MNKDERVDWAALTDQTVTYGEVLDVSNTLWDMAAARAGHSNPLALIAAHEAGKMDMLRIILRAEVEGLDTNWSRNWEFKGALDFITDTLAEEES
jgi:hypothetical protein